MSRLLAKSRSGNYLSLSDHTTQVREAIIYFAKEFGLDTALAAWGAILHDLGKAHPAFQAMLIASPAEHRETWLTVLPASEAIKNELETLDAYAGIVDDRIPVRHELVSLLFLPLFPERHWRILIELVVGHHKSVRLDKSERGFEDLYRIHGGLLPLLERYLISWEEWSSEAITIASSFGITPRDISRTKAEQAFRKCYQLTQNIIREEGYSPWRGLLMTADHFASGYQEATGQKLKKLFKTPSLFNFDQRALKASALLYPLSLKPVTSLKRHTLVTAPTGAGKTDFLLRRCRTGRIFYTLPFQASINAMYQRLRDDIPGSLVTRLHSASTVSLDESRSSSGEEVNLQRFPGSAVKVLTPHQLASLVFALPGHESVALDVRGQHVILDEVHTYNGASQSMVVRLVARLNTLGCSVHVGTATIPPALATQVVNILGGPDEVYSVSLEPEELDGFNRHTVHRTTLSGTEITENAARAIAMAAVERSDKVLFVSNRIATAQERYEWAVKAFSTIPVMLIHSRYKRKDRAKLERQVKMLSDSIGSCICIATQVVEVSLDISFDCLITDAAPLDSLIQRFGRVNRKRTPDTIGRYKPVYVLSPPSDNRSAKPYEPELLRRSFHALPDGEVLNEREVSSRMASVYDAVTLRSIEAHLCVDKTGQLRYGKLLNARRSVIVDALEIAGIILIVEGDVDKYQRADSSERPLYEIPAKDSFLFEHKLGDPLDYGSRPYVIPNDWYHITSKSGRRDSSDFMEGKGLYPQR